MGGYLFQMFKFDMGGSLRLARRMGRVHSQVIWKNEHGGN